MPKRKNKLALPSAPQIRRAKAKAGWLMFTLATTHWKDLSHELKINYLVEQFLEGYDN